MSGFALMGRALITAGIILIVLGTLVMLGPKIPFLGRLPGDIFIQRGKSSFYFPLTTCVIISIILSLLFYLLRK